MPAARTACRLRGNSAPLQRVPAVGRRCVDRNIGIRELAFVREVGGAFRAIGKMLLDKTTFRSSPACH